MTNERRVPDTPEETDAELLPRLRAFLKEWEVFKGEWEALKGHQGCPVMETVLRRRG